MKKTILSLSVLAGAFALSSCEKAEQVQEPKIVQQCNGLVCSFAIEDDTLQRYTNLLGKSTDRVVKRTQLKGAQDSVTWIIQGGGKEANNTQLLDRGLTPCSVDDGDTCSLTSNPTGWVFKSTDPQEVSVSGTIVNADGTTREITKETTVDLSVGVPTVKITKDNAGELNYTFEADPADTGIPTDAKYTWTVDGRDEKVGELVNYLFTKAGTDHVVKLVVSSDELADDIVVTNTITSGAIPPTVEKDTVNGKKVTLTANAADTGLPAGTAFTWSVDGQSGITATGSTVTLDLPSYNTAYNITVKATAPGASSGIESQALSVTTGFGKPVIESSAIGGEGTDYSFTANLDNTGITQAEVYTFSWKFDGAASSETTQTVEHEFGMAGNYTVALTLTLTNGDQITVSPVTITVGAPDIPNLSSDQDGSNPLVWNLSADLLNTGIDDSWTLAWSSTDAGVSFNDTAAQNPTATFDLTSTQYTVKFTATKGGLTRENQETITTGAATTPTITVDNSAGGAEDNNVYTVSVDLTDTGITDDWTLLWEKVVGGTVTFTDATAASTDVTFDYNTTNQIKLTATPPTGSAAAPVVTTPKNIIVGAEPVQYPFTATYRRPTGSNMTAAELAARISSLNLSEAGLTSVIKTDGDSVIFTCSPGYYITPGAEELTPGPNLAFNQGPGDVMPGQVFVWKYSTFSGADEITVVSAFQPQIVLNDNNATTQFGCWKLPT